MGGLVVPEQPAKGLNTRAVAGVPHGVGVAGGVRGNLSAFAGAHDARSLHVFGHECAHGAGGEVPAAAVALPGELAPMISHAPAGGRVLVSGETRGGGGAAYEHTLMHQPPAFGVGFAHGDRLGSERA